RPRPPADTQTQVLTEACQRARVFPIGTSAPSFTIVLRRDPRNEVDAWLRTTAGSPRGVAGQAVAMSGIATLRAVVLDCPDPRGLAAFYRALVGGEITHA